ncbi:MAG: protealysin inhibitor emfourin [Desulfobaccales bacterium]
MHIHFECFGGFANLRLTFTADTDDLPPQLAEELLGLVDASGVFNIKPSEVTSGSHGPPDVLLYQLSLSDAGRVQSLVLNDVTVPVTLRPLLTFLQTLALKQ